MLAVSRAGSFDEFRQAFADFSLPAQNMIYADAKGNIGQLMAVQLPARGDGAPGDMLTPPQASDAAWSRILGSLELPFAYNPREGLPRLRQQPTDRRCRRPHRLLLLAQRPGGANGGAGRGQRRHEPGERPGAAAGRGHALVAGASRRVPGGPRRGRDRRAHGRAVGGGERHAGADGRLGRPLRPGVARRRRLRDLPRRAHRRVLQADAGRRRLAGVRRRGRHQDAARGRPGRRPIRRPFAPSSARASLPPPARPATSAAGGRCTG